MNTAQKRLPLLFLSLLTIAIVILHGGGTFLSLYWRYQGFDKIVHASGGFFVVLFLLSILDVVGHGNVFRLSVWRSMCVAFIIVFIVGIAWEIFEVQVRVMLVGDAGYWIDTVGDIIADIAGGFLAVWYFLYTTRVEKSHE